MTQLPIKHLPKTSCMKFMLQLCPCFHAEYYSLKDIWKEKRCGKFTKGVLFLHDNAPAHQALATQKKLVYLGFQYLDHRMWPRRTTTCSLDRKNN